MESITRRHLTRGLLGFGLAAALGTLHQGAAVADHMGKMHSGGGKVHVSGAWARPSIGAAGNSAAYLTIANEGATGDRLLKASGAVSDKVELHTHIKEGDIMRMRPMEGGVAVAAGETVTFKPGGHHVMLFAVKPPLKEGDRFPLTLTFEKAGEIKVDVEVMKKAPGGAGGGMHHKH